jgi:hypothetical protein
MIKSSGFILLYCYVIIYVVFPVQALLGFVDYNKIELFLVTLENTYSYDTIVKAAITNICLLIAAVLGFKMSKNTVIKSHLSGSNLSLKKIKYTYLFFGIIFLATFVPLVLESDLNYWRLDEIRKQNFALFELRVVIYLIIIFQFSRTRRLVPVNKIEAVIYIVFCLILLLFQARSVVLEVIILVVILGTYSADNFRLNSRVLFLLCVLPFLPNIFVFARLGFYDNFNDNLQQFFRFEYLSIFNLMQFEYIENLHLYDFNFPLIDSLGILLPSVLRDLLGINIIKSNFYELLAIKSQVTFGGMSLPVELAVNFGLFSVILVFCVSYMLGLMRNTFVQRIHTDRFSFILATYPILVSYLIISLRNDLGVLIKQVVYLFIIGLALEILRRVRQ